MARIIGHSSLEDMTCEIALDKPTKLRDVLSRLGMEQQLKDSVLFIRDDKVLALDDLIDDKDTIYLFIMMTGG